MKASCSSLDKFENLLYKFEFLISLLASYISPSCIFKLISDCLEVSTVKSRCISSIEEVTGSYSKNELIWYHCQQSGTTKVVGLKIVEIAQVLILIRKAPVQ